MADDVENPEVAPAKSSPVIWLLICLVSAIGGAALPFVFLMAQPASAKQETADSSIIGIPNAADSVVVPYGEVTVNLDEGRMNRYLRLKIALHVSKKDEAEVLKLVEIQDAVLKNWLLSYLSDKQLEEIRGKVGLNMLRREIRKQFNDTLFVDRRDRIHDILFVEFNVQ